MADKQTKIEIAVGIFMLVGLACISYIAVQLGDLQVLGQKSYIVNARFTSASGLRSGAYIEAAGVRIGTIDSIVFDPDLYQAIVYMAIDEDVPIHEDAVASIRTAGIIGDKFIKITPGGGEYLNEGEEIFETEPSINLEELISKYIFETEK
ncbi:MAG: outer membrane lipid asymmetry maintenance protein MlaD [Gammaproteobacteria bacterium]|jgi:phospholipid/cholesterol/gamma-HCH transport system substrate-binding protein|nr:outer membrane lipid asymmetry maintenance protein MlaD [Gammaproteobacteria bacterium]